MSALPALVRSPVGFPHLIQLPVFAAIFGGAGYMVQAEAGEPSGANGQGTATAWSLSYLFFNGRKALVSRRPEPIALAATVLVNATLNGWEYWRNN